MAPNGNSGTSRGRSRKNLRDKLALATVAMGSFFLGTLFSMHFHIGQCGGEDIHPLRMADIEQRALKRVEELKANLPDCNPNAAKRAAELEQKARNEKPRVVTESSAYDAPLAFPSGMGRYLVGMGRAQKKDFMHWIDTGLPFDPIQQLDREVLLLYQREEALPTRFSEYSEAIPMMQADEALENCDFLNVIVADHAKGKSQCYAVFPQYEGFHLQRWMRMPKVAHGHKQDFGPEKRLNSSLPLRFVGRGLKVTGWDEYEPPVTEVMRRNWDMLINYFNNFDAVLEELKPLVEKVATEKNTVTVMVCNFGQSELLVNFVCSARSRNLDISSILLFATDPEVQLLGETLGLTVFYDERNFKQMPVQAANRYGDKKFTLMMFAKVYCVHMVNALKYNVLFQDVDVIWYKNPVKYFETKDLDFHILFQDDGSRLLRYTPLSANSGFYYVRYNEWTEYLFNSLLLSGDLIYSTLSHQQALVALLNEHASLFGMKVKVFSKEGTLFPAGYHFHQKPRYMKQLYSGKIHPYIFHMSWTDNKENKLLFLRQMGEWYVQEECIEKSVNHIFPARRGENRTDAYLSNCCSAEPLISCHYSDKPSKIPCKDSPTIDEHGTSFW